MTWARVHALAPSLVARVIVARDVDVTADPARRVNAGTAGGCPRCLAGHTPEGIAGPVGAARAQSATARPQPPVTPAKRTSTPGRVTTTWLRPASTSAAKRLAPFRSVTAVRSTPRGLARSAPPGVASTVPVVSSLRTSVDKTWNITGTRNVTAVLLLHVRKERSPFTSLRPLPSRSPAGTMHRCPAPRKSLTESVRTEVRSLRPRLATPG